MSSLMELIGKVAILKNCIQIELVSKSLRKFINQIQIMLLLVLLCSSDSHLSSPGILPFEIVDMNKVKTNE